LRSLLDMALQAATSFLPSALSARKEVSGAVLRFPASTVLFFRFALSFSVRAAKWRLW
jgi:hypothetical protein